MQVGIDIAKLKFDVALLDAKDKYHHKKFNNTEEGFEDFLAWCEKHGALEAHFCMEATGIYYEALANFLFNQGCRVSVTNPAQISGFAKSALSRVKTDKADAKLIARFCKAMLPALYSPTPPKVRELQALVRRVQALKDLEQQELNRLDVSLPIVTPSIESLLSKLKEEIKSLESSIKSHIDNDPDLKKKAELLTSIPGVGSVTSAQMLGELLFECHTSKSIVAFAGLNPKPFESGSSVLRKGRISKTGSAQLRAGLYMPTLVATRYNPDIRYFYQRLLAAGKPKMVALIASMRKLLCLAHAVVTSGIPFTSKCTPAPSS